MSNANECVFLLCQLGLWLYLCVRHWVPVGSWSWHQQSQLLAGKCCTLSTSLWPTV